MATDDRLREVFLANARYFNAAEELRSSVEVAREAGCSWAAIGKVLGVSRQAAWERFGKADDNGDDE